eukprot:Hpha_TRINITY_DN15094_c1_g10::TRINITY_DN15094_c1_g10_i1::g.123779::m.123779/K06994/K06994; putative drug exporter of the RND superfamily
MGVMRTDAQPVSVGEEVVTPGKWVMGYCRMLVNFRWFWLVFMLAVTASSAPFAGKFPSACTTAFNPPPQSMAMKGRREMSKYFPEMDMTSDLVLYVEKKDLKPPVITDRLYNFSTELRERGTTEWGAPGFVLSMEGYFSMLETVGPMGADNFLSRNPVNVSTFFDFRLRTAMTSKDAVAYSEWLTGLVLELQEKYHLEDCEFTQLGAPAFINTILDASSRDLEHMDGIVLPIAVLILAWIVRSLRLLIAPLVALGVSTAVSFGIMYMVAQSMNVFSGASALMMSILIAMSIDYGLFLLTRYREELEKGVANELAVGRMIVSAGHTIVVSGLTLSMCFFGLTFLQNDFMVSVGMGCGIVLLCVLAMNLIVTPLLMLNFPKFFYRSLYKGACCPPRAWCCSQEGRDEVKQSCCGNDDADDASDARVFWSIQEAEGASGASGEEEEEPEYSEEGKLLDSSSSDSVDRNSTWYRVGGYLVRWPWNILAVICVVGSVLYCCTFATTYRVTNNNMYYLPRDADVATAYRHMGETFGFGQVWSFQLLLIPQVEIPGGAYLVNNSKAGYWKQSQALIKHLEDNVKGTGSGNIAGALVAPYTKGDTVITMNVSEELVEFCLGCREHPAQCKTSISEGLDPVCSQCAMGNESCNSAICTLTSYISPDLNKQICNDTKAEQQFYREYCLPTPDPAKVNKTLCAGTLLSYDQFVDDRKDATWVRFTPPFAPEGVQGSDWLHAARKAAEEFPRMYGIKMDIVGQPCDGIDAMDSLYDEFPAMVGVTSAVVTVFVGLAFRSVFVPLRSVATIALTIMFVQGLAALVYQHGALDWTGFSGFRSTNAVIYINPLLSFSIIVGIGLDYDIFLITRIVEYRKIFGRIHPERTDFENTQEAIKVGLTKTAGIITAAGVIMAIAFSGLLLSKEPEMNQLAFYMVFAVIFDTFIIRPVLVPATMSLLFELNWWPCTFRSCGTTKTEDDVESVTKGYQINSAE